MLKKIVVYITAAGLGISLIIPLFGMQDPYVARLQATEAKARALNQRYAQKNPNQVTVEDWDNAKEQREYDQEGDTYDYYNACGEQITKQQYYKRDMDQDTSETRVAMPEHEEQSSHRYSAQSKPSNSQRFLAAAASIGAVGAALYMAYVHYFSPEPISECTLFGIYPVACSVVGMG